MQAQDNPLQDYPVVIELPVLWGDMDAFQHVNNVIYFRYFESVRIAHGDRIEMHRFMAEQKVGPILASTSCNFLKPLRYPDTLLVGCRTTKLSDSEMEQEYAIYSRRLKRVAAIGTGKIVAYHYGELRRATFPPEMMDLIVRLEGKAELGRQSEGSR